MSNSIFYSPHGLLSQRCILNFIIGNRGGGKTFGFKDICIKRFKKKGQQFIWVRRYQTEVDTLSNFWDDIKPFYPNDELTVEGACCYINGELAGWLIALTTSMKLKSVAYPNVTTIVFDEFIIDKGKLGYLKNEVQVFLELYETVARMRDNVTAVFLGNAISIVNPYFVYFGITPDLNKRFTKKGGVCVEFYFNEAFINKKKQTRFGRLIEGTKYGEYNMLNKFLRDSDSFIVDSRPASANLKIHQFIIDGERFALWQDTKRGEWYIDNAYESNFGTFRTFITNHVDMDEKDKSHILLKKNATIVKRLRECAERGDLYFNNQNTKQKFYEILLTNF